jgi:hypothetical protein
MPMLGDYLGHLLSEITAARMQADLETARIAELYATHPLLRRMPVPRFRVPNVTVDVPVSVTRMEEAAAGQPRRGGLSISALTTAVEAAVDATLPSFVKMTVRGRAEVRAAAVAAVRPDALPGEVALTPRRLEELGTRVAAVALDEVAARHDVDPETAERLRSRLASAAAAAIANAVVAPPRLHVAVTSRELREAGPLEMLARLKLTISEEAMEWSVSESEGTTTARLIPE